MRIGIVVGETSGDYLGAGLISALRERVPDLQVTGICGPRMRAAGLESMFPMDSISIMGFDGLVSGIREILRIRRGLVEKFLADPPDVFVGVDVPDFNLTLEEKLRKKGVRTVHYVSPTVWAWRGYRIHKIRRAVDHMLTLFPFEADYYRTRGVPVTFVGHPIADEIPEHYDVQALRAELGVGAGPVVALLPGSRLSELKHLGALFVETARRLRQRNPELQFIAPLANDETRSYFETLLSGQRDLAIRVVAGRSRDAMAAADIVLLASGTAAVEAALLARPMVVAYKVSKLTGMLVRMFAHVEYFSMPNNLLHEPIVPEILQDNATSANLAAAVTRYLEDDVLRRDVAGHLSAILPMLRCDANRRAADAVLAQAGATRS